MSDIKKELNILLIGEENITGSLINSFYNEQSIPVFFDPDPDPDAADAKISSITKYSINVRNLTLNFYDIPSIEHEHECDKIATAKIKKGNFNIILCVLDGVRKHSRNTIKQSIAFIKTHVPNTTIPVLFVIAKEHSMPKGKVNRMMRSIKEHAHDQIEHYNIVSVASMIYFSRLEPLWSKFVACLPDCEHTLKHNFNFPARDKILIQEHTREHILTHYKTIPEIAQKIRNKKSIVKKMRSTLNIATYIYIALYAAAFIILALDPNCIYNGKIQNSAIVCMGVLFLFKVITQIYSKSHYRVFPTQVKNVDTIHGCFNGQIDTISRDRTRTQFSGSIIIDGLTHNVLCNDGAYRGIF